MFLFLVYTPLFLPRRLMPKPSMTCLLCGSATHWYRLNISFPSFPRAEMSHSISGDSRKLGYILAADLLGEERQIFCASWWKRGRNIRMYDANRGCWAPSRNLGCRFSLPREQHADPGQHSRHWNHQLGEPSPRRIEFGIVSRVGDASPVSVLPCT